MNKQANDSNAGKISLLRIKHVLFITCLLALGVAIYEWHKQYSNNNTKPSVMSYEPLIPVPAELSLDHIVVLEDLTYTVKKDNEEYIKVKMTLVIVIGPSTRERLENVEFQPSDWEVTKEIVKKNIPKIKAALRFLVERLSCSELFSERGNAYIKQSIMAYINSVITAEKPNFSSDKISFLKIPNVLITDLNIE